MTKTAPDFETWMKGFNQIVSESKKIFEEEDSVSSSSSKKCGSFLGMLDACFPDVLEEIKKEIKRKTRKCEYCSQQHWKEDLCWSKIKLSTNMFNCNIYVHDEDVVEDDGVNMSLLTDYEDTLYMLGQEFQKICGSCYRTLNA